MENILDRLRYKFKIKTLEPTPKGIYFYEYLKHIIHDDLEHPVEAYEKTIQALIDKTKTKMDFDLSREEAALIMIRIFEDIGIEKY